MIVLSGISLHVSENLDEVYITHIEYLYINAFIEIAMNGYDANALLIFRVMEHGYSDNYLKDLSDLEINKEYLITEFKSLLAVRTVNT